MKTTYRWYYIVKLIGQPRLQYGCKYLVKVNGDIIGFANTLREAKEIGNKFEEEEGVKI